MKIKNIAIVATQTGVSVALAVVTVPSVIAFSTLATIGSVAKTTSEAGTFVVKNISKKGDNLIKKLEKMKEREIEIVKSPLGDDAIVVN
jgi:hypothetical protein